MGTVLFSPRQRRKRNVPDYLHGHRLLGVGLAFLLGLAGGGSAGAERIRLTDGTELSASVVDKDGEGVTLKLRRSEVATVDGQPLPAPVAAGFTAPQFEARDLSGTRHALAGARGQVTLLTFWATWCPHCRADIPLIKHLFARYQGKGVAILTVSVDQDPIQLRAFVRDQQLPYPVISASDPAASAQQRELPDRYEVRGIPAYYVIDAQGIVSQAFSGSAVEGERDLEGELKRLLAASATTKP
jgi:peroxiredoxin